MSNHHGAGLLVASRLNCDLFLSSREKTEVSCCPAHSFKYATQNQNINTQRCEYWLLRIKNVQNAQDRN